MRLDVKFLRSHVSRRITLLFFIAALLPTSFLALLTYRNATRAIASEHKRELIEASRAYAQAVLGRLLFAQAVAEQATRDSRVSTTLAGMSMPMFQSLESRPLPAARRTETPLRIEAASQSGDDATVTLVATGEHEQLLARLRADFLWGDRADVDSAYNICIYSGSVRLHCSYPDELQQARGVNTVQQGQWDLFLKPTLQVDTWSVVTSRRFPAAETSMGKSLWTYLMVALLSVLLILLLSLILIRRTMVPLEKLIAGAKRIAVGDYGKIDIRSRDEFGDLAGAVNHMSEQIRQQLDTLHILSSIDHQMRERLELRSFIQMVGTAMRSLVPGASLYVARCRSEELATDCLYIDCEQTALLEQEISISTDEIALLEQHPAGLADYRASFLPPIAGDRQSWSVALFWQGRRCGALSLVWGANQAVNAATRNTLIELANRVAIAIQIQEREQRLLYQALFDELTGLLNRRGLEQKIAQIMQHNTPAAVLFIDIDRFKQVNDGFGHKVGDQLLRQIAERIVTCSPRCVAGRLGGDEFIILLDTPEQENAAEVATTLMQSLARLFVIDSQQISITASIGIALHPAPINDDLTLIERADIAMYQSKQGGRNGYRFYTERMNLETHQRLAMEEDLRLALPRGEFVLHYQPKVDLASDFINGAEALVRWNHPLKGMVFPGQFISVAEETGFIVLLGTWVMQEACRQNMRWRDQGLAPLRIAVNVSPRQFSEPGFVATVEEILQQTGLPADGLEIEVTESMLMNDIEQSIGILNALSQLGVNLSIDDFGTGYSSLAYLKRFPINILKIDQSFIRDLVNDNDDRLIISSIIALAHSLELRVVAEGVETREQLDYLQKQQCDEIQGYYFSRPVEAGQFAQLMGTGKQLSGASCDQGLV